MSALAEISVAITIISAVLKNHATLTAIAPLPVPMSAIIVGLSMRLSLRLSLGGDVPIRETTSSTRTSVSGLGISTCSFTVNSKDMNSFLPVI